MRDSKNEMDLTLVVFVSRGLLIGRFLVVETLPFPKVITHQGVLPVERMLVHVVSRKSW